MDLIDLLHVNNDIMSYSLAFASLAYSVGGLLSGFLFNYVNRQILISAYFFIFGLSNIVTPFIGSYLIFSVITVFKMMCAGGTDCAANVWILEMWPGQDAWLQALHFSFAVGCALGPLIVEPFLSVEYKDTDLDKIANKTTGSTTISDQNNETRIHIPYGLSGLVSISASLYIIYLYWLDQRYKQRQSKLRAKQQVADGESILMSAIQPPAQLEAGSLQPVPEEDSPGVSLDPAANEQPEEESPQSLPPSPPPSQQDEEAVQARPAKLPEPNALLESARFLEGDNPAATPIQANLALSAAPDKPSGGQEEDSALQPQPPPLKITSKARADLVGRPPYYVMFAIALAAMCLSFYCGIEITSMNYLATFAVNINLQLPKSTAALMSSALTISFAVGRGFGIWIANYMKPHKLFYLCCGVMAAGNVAMLIFANTAETLLWYSICLFGIGCGPMFPAIVSFYDDKISKVTNTVSGIFILGSMFNVALNSLIIGHHIIDNALILIVCNLIGSVLLLLLFGTLHMLTKVKKNQRVRKFKLRQLQAARSNHPA